MINPKLENIDNISRQMIISRQMLYYLNAVIISRKCYISSQLAIIMKLIVCYDCTERHSFFSSTYLVIC